MFGHGFPPYWSTLKKLIWLVGSGAAGGLSIRTITGSIVSFIAKKVTPIEELKVAIEPVQSGSGDPSPDNVRPITGWTGCEVRHTGANLLGGDALKDAVVASMPSTYVDTTDKYVSFASNAAVVKAISYPLAGKFKENTQYTFIMTIYKTSGTGSNLLISYTDGTYGRIPVVSASGVKETKVFVTDAGKTVLSFSKNNQSGNTRIYYEESGIFEGVLTAEDFKAYQGTTYPISWQTEAGTVYGGTLTVNEDGSVDLITTHRYIQLDGTESWNASGSSTARYLYRLKIDNANTFYASTAGRFKCSHFKSAALSTNNSTLGCGLVANSAYGGDQLYFRPGSAVTQSSKTTEWETWLANQYANGTPVEIVAELQPSSQTTYHLDSIEQLYTLVGENNIWADCGDVTVTAVGIREITPSSAQALNMLLGGMYTNNHTPDDVSDNEALNIILGGSNA